MSDDLRVILAHAQDESARRHGNYVDSEHLLLGLLRHQSGPVQMIFTQRGIDAGALYDQVAQNVGMERPDPAPVKGMSRRSQTIIERAQSHAGAMGQYMLNGGHLLLALMDEQDGPVHDALSSIPLTSEGVRTYLRTYGPAGSAALPSRPAGSKPNRDKPEVILVPFREKRKRPTGSQTGPLAMFQTDSKKPWVLLGAFIILVALIAFLPPTTSFIFIFVLVGWVFSLCLHEFSHALVAYYGGDYTVKDKGYLSFNPLKYTHPVLSILMPLLFLAMGGIGLPGGAVYIDRSRLKNEWWGAAVSAAGPAANILFLLVLSLPFLSGVVEFQAIRDNFREYDGLSLNGPLFEKSALWTAVAFLAYLQIFAVCLNLLPIPGLDGFGIIEPLLDYKTRMQLLPIAQFGFIILLCILWSPLGTPFYNMVDSISNSLSIPPGLVGEGWRAFQFWRQG
jgi:Zn-dependent protease